VKSIPAIAVTIKKPTMTKAGAVAKAGIAKKIGAKNKDKAKKIAVKTEASPVLPPAATPAALSTKVVVVLVPRAAPAQVAMASDKRAP